ncbi:resolvase-like protein [Herbihabitans rhizosphaerae]|uniref:Resolvase-like protein n=1 Tax=Herbihabitans rhizosphaerae TaxID=1872711 RepID=A0A4Q7L9H6_9PSEU|nr:recombinase family protein [Herbihabitans rhizosphaerae]RZS45092.1 resolvase-like protein [Herbihabitans rhizosphaerae]
MTTRTIPAPLVYGYVCSSLDRPDFIGSCKDTLADWCVREGWRLGGVFTDVGAPQESVDRVAFSGLLDALNMPRAAGVVVVDGAHLSPRAEIVFRLVRQIRQRNAAVLVMDGGLPTAAERLCRGQAVTPA